MLTTSYFYLESAPQLVFLVNLRMVILINHPVPVTCISSHKKLITFISIA
ncbi:hypothetical protein FX988_02953 [Paraglaciecola mesophila]|uniref:Uncharacterized protein n=1 Tax=Paraglaciecola mesophila TaxID=197222 RepID=A0A857JKW5_9ALTE|nr:hypothetical protein FX988_02953 [Paraglaciecola mesophila]